MSPDRDELVRLVERVMFPPACSTEEEGDAAIAEIERQVPRPGVTDLMFYPERTEGRSLLRGRGELTPEEVVDLALAYMPIQL